MARIRSLKPAFFTSDDVCGCSALGRLLFLGLLTEADKSGRLEDRPRQLKRRLLQDDDCDVDAILWELVDRGLVSRYQADGVDVIHITTFAKHQKPHPKETESVLPVSGTEKPRLNPASPEKVFEHPVENPSCPRRGFNGSGDLSNGSGDLGAGAEQPPARPLISGESSPKGWDKIHGAHATGFCDWVCLPQFLMDEFVRKSAGLEYVRGWAARVRGGWDGQPVGDNLQFWRRHWSEGHPVPKGNTKPVTRTAEQVKASMREKGML